MKSGKQRRTEIQVQRAEQRDDAADAAAKLRLDERARNAKLANSEKARELALVSKRLHVNPANLGPNVSWGWPEFVHRGYYVDQPLPCRACGKEQVWSATQQRWWFESAKGDVWTVAVHCRTCRIKERERKNLARRTHREGVARKRSDGA